MYVFLDLETTGLDPQRDHILQLAMIVADPALNVIGDPFVSDVALTETGAGRLYLNAYVREMHRETGLLARLEALHAAPAHDCSGWRVEQRALDYLERDGYELPDRITLAGNSVHFDASFLRVHMPMLAARFSHRLMDVSVLRMFETKFGDGPIDAPVGVAHDALSDARSSLEQLRGYVARRRGAQ